MIRNVLPFSIFVLTFATMSSLARTPCSIHKQLNQSLLATGLDPIRETDLQLMVCLVCLHDFHSHHLSKSDSLVGLNSKMGMFGLDPSMLYLCDSIKLTFDDDDLSDEVLCYMKIRRNPSFFHSQQVVPEDFCREISTEETPSFSVKYDYIMCADHLVIVPSENSKRLYRILSGQETNYTSSLDYRQFSVNVAYYDGAMYANFFLDRSRHLWRKLNKTLYDLTHRPIRLTVLLLIVCFILILALRYLTTSFEQMYLHEDQRSGGSINRGSISTSS